MTSRFFKRALYVALSILTLGFASSALAGFYVGAQGGWIYQSFEHNRSVLLTGFPGLAPPPVVTHGNDISTAIGGAFIGYNMRFSRFDIALEGFGNFFNAQSVESDTQPVGGIPQTNTLTIKIDNQYGASLNPGFYITPTVMIFGRAGFVVTTADYQFQRTAPVSVVEPEAKKEIVGGIFGLGVQKNFGKRVSVRVEDDYIDYQKENFQTRLASFGPTMYSDSFKALSMDSNQIMGAFILHITD